MVDAALAQMSPEIEAFNASGGRPSIAPEYLLRAQLIQMLYAIPSERRLVGQLRYNLLLRWFVGLPLDEPVFHATSFTKNRDRQSRPTAEHGVKLLARAVDRPERRVVRVVRATAAELVVDDNRPTRGHALGEWFEVVRCRARTAVLDKQWQFGPLTQAAVANAPSRSLDHSSSFFHSPSNARWSAWPRVLRQPGTCTCVGCYKLRTAK